MSWSVLSLSLSPSAYKVLPFCSAPWTSFLFASGDAAWFMNCCIKPNWSLNFISWILTYYTCFSENIEKVPIHSKKPTNAFGRKQGCSLFGWQHTLEVTEKRWQPVRAPAEFTYSLKNILLSQDTFLKKKIKCATLRKRKAYYSSLH